MSGSGQPSPVAVVDEGLGNSCYLLDLGDAQALVVDPPRDLRALRSAAATRGLRIRFAADTHLHADFLSGAAQLASDDGVQVLASASGRRAFAHRGLVDEEEVDLGGLRLRALATPGHTDEHLSYLVLDGPAALGVFSGGSLIVGSAARTDLLGEERTEELARAQFASLQRLAALPADTGLWPTHGAGSFCSAPPGAARTSTIGREVATNPLLASRDEAGFVAALLGSLGSYPTYFARLGEINRRGAAILDPAAGDRLARLSVADVRRQLAEGAVVIDVRTVVDYTAAHIPAALSIPLRAQFATWLGWLASPDVPMILVRDPGQPIEEVMWPALNIGYERFAGELDGGLDAWIADGQPVSYTELITPEQIGDRRVIDIRQEAEFAGGHLPGAEHLELGSVAQTAEEVPAEPTVLMCGHGERATGAASLLERAGHRDLAVLAGGPEDWARVTGRDLQTR